MLLKNKIIQKTLTCFLSVILACTALQAQTLPPTWWFGVSGAANFNFYDGTTQRLDNSLIVPAAFHKGNGIRPYGSILMEYRPASIWGGMLNVAYDGRGGKFKDVVAPCNCPATLETNTSYVAIEPSVRLRVAASDLYFFAGPRVAFNITKDFSYTQLKQPNTDAELSGMRNTILSGQVGVGYDLPVSSPNSTTKVTLSPFVSYHPYFGQDPRNIESWSVTTVRAGIALKFGKTHKSAVKLPIAALTVPAINFFVRAPKMVPLKRQVSETLPLLNAVFFDDASTEVPNRYIALTKSQASSFKEEQLQNEQSENMTGRSARQLNVYHNMLNILGDRMRSNPGTSISLTGASAKGPQDAKALAESVKRYLVTAFGINGSRIVVEARTKPLVPSEQTGGTKDLVLLRAEDRRVDIKSTSPELTMEVGGGMMKPVKILALQVDPLDSHVVLNVDSAKQKLKSWSVNVTDAKGTVQHYGPFSRNQESVPGTTILGSNTEGDYQVTMLGETKNGQSFKKESSVHLVRQNQVIEKGMRYSIVFDFDKANSIASYDKFLTDVVSPLISDGSTVIIHGHTDVIGDDEYNQTLSESRAQQAQKIIESALLNLGRKNVKFETYGFGKDISHSPFENDLPEDRFYNRTVIIDIVPVK
jgi:outer membrane protein OmpA-like peptidoglycan-associated protein